MSKRATTRQANAEFKAAVGDLFEAAVGYKAASDVSKTRIKDLLENHEELQRQIHKIITERDKITDELKARLKPVADVTRELGITGMYVSVQPDGRIRFDVRYDDEEYVRFYFIYGKEYEYFYFEFD